MARAAWIAISRARAFNTGSAPGRPRHTGQTLVLGGAPKPVGHPQKILVRVLSWTCTSNPITGSYFAISSGVATPKPPEAMLHYRKTYGKPMWGGQSCPQPPFQAAFLVGARRLKAGGSQDWLPHTTEDRPGFQTWPRPSERLDWLYWMRCCCEPAR